MSEPRPTHSPSGAKLLNESKANPASVNMDIFAKKSARNGAATGQGTVNSNYLRETREQNPDPAQDQKEKPQVSLSNCKFATPVADLKLNEEFEFSVEVKKIGQPKSLQATFDLYATRKREGKEQRDKIWSGKEGKPVDAKAEPVVLKGKDVLATQADYVLGELVTFELEAIHSEAEQSAKSEKVEVSLKTVAHWLGGDDLFFRNDGEFPLLGAEGSLIGVLVAAVERFKKPGQDGETAICFGFASSAGEADANRSLSLRRAKVVKALLDRDEAAWVELAKANFETVDIQQFLSDLHTACGWECDPGEVNGQAGPKTKAAIESFQNECNARYNLGLKPDGVCGPKTWAAVHRAILGQVQAAMDEDATKAPAWPKPKWGNKGKGLHANGEDYATGGDKPEERSVQITFFAPGSEPPLKEVAAGQKASPEHNPVQQPDRVEKKKVEKGAGGAANQSNPPDHDELFSITSGEVGALKPSDFAFFDRETKRCQLISKEVSRYFYPDAVAVRSRIEDLKRAQFTKACLCLLNQFSNESDESKADQMANEAARIIEDNRKKIEQDESFADRILVKGSGMESGWVQKVYRTSGKRAVWVRGTVLKSHVRMMSKQQALQAIKKEYREDAKEAKKNSTGKSPVKINDVTFYELFDAQKGTWAPIIESYFDKFGLGEYLQENSVMQAGVDLQAMRFSLEGKVGSNINWKEKREIKVEAKVEGSISLIAGQGHFDIYLPSKDGFDFIEVVKTASPKLFKAGTKPMPMQVQLKVTGNAFVGVCGSASGGLGLSLKEKPQGGLECGIEAFAGAKVGAELGIAIRIKLWDEKTNVGKFEDLSEVSYGLWAAAGFGAEFAFKLGYFDGRFRMQFKAGLVLKAGAGHYLKTSINANKIATTIWTVCCAVRWDRVHDVLSDAVWDFYQGMMYNALVTGQSLEQSAVKLLDEIDAFSESASKAAEVGLSKLKSADDNLDKYIPGYSGFKKFHPTFHILKSTYESLKAKNQALDARERAIRIIQETDKFDRWKYMTPEIKENLLAELAYGGSGIEGVDEQKEKAIIRVLDKTKSPEEFRKILDRLKTRRSIDLEKAVDGPELELFLTLKVKNGYR